MVNAKNISEQVTFTFRRNLVLVNDFRENLTIYVAKRNRLHLYFNGIQSRFDQILNQYVIENIPNMDNSSGWIIDVGANIGEFSMALSRKFPGHRFLLIEPGEGEIYAARKNLQNIPAHLVCSALWSENKELLFYHANETGDSSLLPADITRPSEYIRVRTLDSLISEYQIKEIHLLKLEGEGAEPEILQGAAHALRISQYVTADLVPERGIQEARTYEDCRDILESAGFEEIATYSGGRETYLFRNKNFGA